MSWPGTRGLILILAFITVLVAGAPPTMERAAQPRRGTTGEETVRRDGMVVLGPRKQGYSVTMPPGGGGLTPGVDRKPDGEYKSVDRAASGRQARTLYGLPYPIVMLGLLAFLFVVMGLCVRE